MSDRFRKAIEDGTYAKDFMEGFAEGLVEIHSGGLSWAVEVFVGDVAINRVVVDDRERLIRLVEKVIDDGCGVTVHPHRGDQPTVASKEEPLAELPATDEGSPPNL